MSAVKEDGPGKSRRVEDELARAARGETTLAGGLGPAAPPRVRAQKIERPAARKKSPTIIDTRTHRPQPPGSPPSPVRTVVYVEVGEMDAERVAVMAEQFAHTYEGSVHGPHYFVPVRDGRIRTELEFEGQFLSTVHELCEIRDGQIVLKGGAEHVQVMRNFVDGGE